MRVQWIEGAMEGGCSGRTEGAVDRWRVQGTDGGCSAWLSEEHTAVVSGAAPQAEDKDLMTMGIRHCSNLLRPMSESTSSVQNCATQKKEKREEKQPLPSSQLELSPDSQSPEQLT